MYILVTHAISRPAEFWGAVQKFLTTLPQSGVKEVVNLFPSENMDQCTSVWEAESMETLGKYLQSMIGDISKATYYQINEANALGLKEPNLPL